MYVKKIGGCFVAIAFLVQLVVTPNLSYAQVGREPDLSVQDTSNKQDETVGKSQPQPRGNVKSNGVNDRLDTDGDTIPDK